MYICICTVHVNSNSTCTCTVHYYTSNNVFSWITIVIVTVHVYSVQGKKIEATPLSMYNYFIERVRENLHVVLAMSPIGDAFRNRLRMFPSLINCCTIDWFQV